MPQTREARVARTANARAAGRDIGPIPAPANKRRRKKYANDLLGFMRFYLAARFPKPFSPDHLRAIGLLQTVILGGGLFAVAMPRGSGKTTMCEGALVWALAYGHRRFVMAIASDEKKALLIMGSVKAEFSYNERLAADFPDVCFPIASLGSIARRAEGQRSEGTETKLVWTKDEVRLPRFAAGGGSCIRCAGMTGAIRGAKAVLADGSQIRPDLVLVDDPQTDASARSPSQVESRMATMQTTILGLAGPGESIACLATCTVIVKDDLAEQLLDRKLNPAWQGVKSRLVNRWPTRTDLWDAYIEILREDQRIEAGMARATEFYRANKAAMDEGAEAAWPERHEKSELSAIQHAFNLREKHKEMAFASEFQNEPLDTLSSSEEFQQITPRAVLKKLNHHVRGIVPHDASILTAGIDCHLSALYFGACAWSPSFSGDLIAYGTYPDQGRPYFRLNEIEKTIKLAHPGGTPDATLYAALSTLVEMLVEKEWSRDDGSSARIDLVVIDAGYMPDVVYQFARRSKYSSLIMPYKGMPVKIGETPMDEWKKKVGDRIGQGWRITRPSNRPTRAVLADTNKCKSFIADRILAEPGSPASFGIYGDSPSEHRMLADHLSSEIREAVTKNGRTGQEWKAKPNQDNHLFDVINMSAIAAAIRGAKLDPRALVAPPRPAAAPSQQQGGEQPAPARPAARPSLPAMPAAGGWMDGFTAGGDTGGWQ